MENDTPLIYLGRRVWMKLDSRSKLAERGPYGMRKDFRGMHTIRASSSLPHKFPLCLFPLLNAPTQFFVTQSHRLWE